MRQLCLAAARCMNREHGTTCDRALYGLSKQNKQKRDAAFSAIMEDQTECSYVSSVPLSETRQAPMITPFTSPYTK